MSPTERAPEVRETAADVSVAGQMVEASLEDLDQRVEPLQTVAERERDRAVLWQDPGGFVNDQAEGFSDYTGRVADHFGRREIWNPNGDFMEAAPTAALVGGGVGLMTGINTESLRTGVATGAVTAGAIALEASTGTPLNGGVLSNTITPATQTVLYTALSLPENGYHLAEDLGMSDMDARVFGGAAGLRVLGYGLFATFGFLKNVTRSAEEKRNDRIEREGRLGRTRGRRLTEALNHRRVNTLGKLYDKLKENNEELLTLLGLAGLGDILRENENLGDKPIDSTTFTNTLSLLADNRWLGRFSLAEGNRARVATAEVRSQFLQEFNTWASSDPQVLALTDLSRDVQDADTVTQQLQSVANHFRNDGLESRNMTITLQGGVSVNISQIPRRIFREGRFAGSNKYVNPNNIYDRFAGTYEGSAESGNLTSGYEFTNGSTTNYTIGYYRGRYYLQDGTSTRRITGFSHT